MPARKGWVEEGTEYFFWAVSDQFPEFRHRLRHEITAHNGSVYVYFTFVRPTAVLEYVNAEFFKRFNIPILDWEPMVRRWDGQWKAFESFGEKAQEAMAAVDFGWCRRDSVLMERYPPFLVEESKGKIMPLRPTVNPGSTEIPTAPTFLRKVMD